MINPKTTLPAILMLIFVFTNTIAAQNNDSSDTTDPALVLEKYVEAIGGRDALSNVQDKSTIMRGTAMGQSITLIVKQKAPNKLRQEVKAGGMEQVIIFDGEKGVMNVMDQKIEVKDKELEALKLEANMDFLLDPQKYGVDLTFEGVESINGRDANKVKIVLPSGLRWFSFYDVESGLKIKEQREIQTQMGLGEQTVSYEDYKEIEGVKYPHKIIQSFGGQSVEVTVSSIKINKGLSDEIFVISE